MNDALEALDCKTATLEGLEKEAKDKIAKIREKEQN